ncbi:Importin subunit alpha-3 [Thelohanellus kitauei]|uniref:Importin subunit alpha-3 n=1 Tax=Thelohanellus kitauei TaxID=669202 RepID=A0A0C2N2T9_THEKT|nr:Importin subunit alpha-3 [Thelohanellus kitauei]
MENDDLNLDPTKFSADEGKDSVWVPSDPPSQKLISSENKPEKILRRRNNNNRPLIDKFSRYIITSIEEVEKLVEECASSNRDVAYHAVLNLRLHLCSKYELYLDKLFQTDVKYNAAWALAYFASGDSHHTLFLIKESVITALCSLLRDLNPSLVEQSIWALSNIIADGPIAREFVLSLNLLSALNQPLYLHYKSIPLIKHISWMLINICTRKQIDVPIEYVPQIIPILDVLLTNTDEIILDDVLTSIVYLADSSSKHVSLLIESGIVDKVYKFLGVSQRFTINALRVIGCIAASIEEHTQYLLDHGILFHLQPLLNSKNKKVKKQLYWVLSNFAAGTRSQMLALFSLNIFPQIIKDLEEGIYAVRREACLVICNIIHEGTYQEVQQFIESDVLYFMRIFLETQDNHMIVAILKVVVILLRLYSANNSHKYMCNKIEESGVLHCINKLQAGSAEYIRFWTAHILEKHFSKDMEKDVKNENISHDDQSGLSSAAYKYVF